MAAKAQNQAADQQQQQQQQQRGAGRDMSKVQQLLETRVCGSPAVDGYAHVEPPCLEGSPTNKWWQENKPRPDDLDIWIEREADYDGLAGKGFAAPSVSRARGWERRGQGGGDAGGMASWVWRTSCGSMRNRSSLFGMRHHRG